MNWRKVGNQSVYKKNKGKKKERKCRTCGFYFTNPLPYKGTCSVFCFNLRAAELKKRKLKNNGARKLKTNSKAFYESREWKELRYITLRTYGFMCMACYRKGVELHVDHIKPVSIHPELRLNPNNLQVLCRECNLGKSNLFMDDLRPNTTL